MNRIFTYADDSTDFENLKARGAKAVLIKYSSKISRNIERASSLGMKILVEIPRSRKDDVNVIRPIAGRVFLDDGEINYAGVNDIKKVIKKIGNGINKITGFVLPVPKINGLLWNDEIERICNVENGEIYDLFDEETEISHIRSVYYINAENYIFQTYILPQKLFLESVGKKAIFHIGRKELYYEFAGTLINPIGLKRSKISLGISGELGTAQTLFGLGGEDFLFRENTCEKIYQKRFPKEILLVRPVRGVLERYVETGRKSRLETPALSADIEGVYFCEMLKEKGYFFDVADEFSFLSKKNFGRYKDILICKSCLFSDKEISKINRLVKKGVRINSPELLSELSKQGEE